MAMTVWSELADMERRMDDFFSDFNWGRPFGLRPRTQKGRFVPAADVFARNGDLVVRAELPGIDTEKDLKVTLVGGELVIMGERKQRAEIKQEDYYRLESSYGSFERHIPVPEGTDESKVKAEYKDGVLEVRVEGGGKAIQAESPKVTTIEVKSAK